LISPGSEWPEDVAADLGKNYYELAEERRRVGIGVYPGPLQVQVLGRLQRHGAYTPPLGFDFTLSKTSYLHDSSVARLWKLNLEDSLDADSDGGKRLFIVPDTVATRFVVTSGQVESVECYSRASKQVVSLSAPVVLCAASAIESARLVLNSKMIHPKATGRYLADHITCRQEELVASSWSAAADGHWLEKADLPHRAVAATPASGAATDRNASSRTG
jgi:hypothetical protein